MAERFFDLRPEDRREALAFGREKTGRPAHLLEKDVWVVWTLRALFESNFGDSLTFKGGTSLSKAYGIIDRFSEDLDLTLDIRQLIPAVVTSGGLIPTSRSQADKYDREIRDALPDWISNQVIPCLAVALNREGMEANLSQTDDDADKVYVRYQPLTHGTGYVAPVVLLEFGARSTGEPNLVLPITCDLESHLPGVEFPRAAPRVLSLARTFWEKVTAAHVFCAQGIPGGKRIARHWYDLICISTSPSFDEIVANRSLASEVASHKSRFFRAKDSAGQWINYQAAVGGSLKIVPEGPALEALEKDYAAMVADGVLLGEHLAFEKLLQASMALEQRLNRETRPIGIADKGSQ